MKVFVDTAAWIALFNKKDELHDRAIQIRKELRQQKASLVTTEFVLIEVADGLCNASIRKQTIDFIDSLYRFPKLQIIQVSHDLVAQGWLLYKQRPDKGWSLTDCISFVVMEQLKIKQAFTCDRHFEQAGFINLL
jgi:uncharacterized protein